MPAKDRHHDAVVRALEKAGWQVVRENVAIGDEVRQLLIDILARRGGEDIILVEVKSFEGVPSPVTLLEKAIGQYMLYTAVLNYLGDETPLYLAVSGTAYTTFLSESLIHHVLGYLKVKLMVFDPVYEEITQWIT